MWRFVFKNTEKVCGLTSGVIINHSNRLPFEEVHQVQDGPAQRGEVGVEADVEDVSVVWYLVLPLGLDVRNSQGVANRLDRISWGTVGGAEDGCHPQRELVTGWREETFQQLASLSRSAACANDDRWSTHSPQEGRNKEETCWNNKSEFVQSRSLVVSYIFKSLKDLICKVSINLWQWCF